MSVSLQGQARLRAHGCAERRRRLHCVQVEQRRRWLAGCSMLISGVVAAAAAGAGAGGGGAV